MVWSCCLPRHQPRDADNTNYRLVRRCFTEYHLDHICSSGCEIEELELTIVLLCSRWSRRRHVLSQSKLHRDSLSIISLWHTVDKFYWSLYDSRLPILSTLWSQSNKLSVSGRTSSLFCISTRGERALGDISGMSTRCVAPQLPKFMSVTNDCQVHYAGNLQIAASAFVTLGLLLSLILVATTALSSGRSSDSEQRSDERGSAGKEGHSGNHSRHHASSHSERSSRSPIAAIIVALLIASVGIGAMLQILAQYFGVIGLTLNATPNAASAATGSSSQTGNFVADEWVLERGLTTYATVAWTSAIACAIVARSTFSLPKYTKLS